ncbi:MAG: hypothetical protein KJ847_02435 [Firmicutes bacterium]|nr:hypothetical protein [Bacillota bacterium]
MKKWKLLTILMILVLIPIGIACKERYDINENVIIIDAIPFWGEGAQCNITTFNTSMNIVSSSWMDRNGFAYKTNLTTLPRGTYTSSIVCNLTANMYLGECKFKVGEEISMWEITVAIGIACMMFLFLALFFKFQSSIRFAFMLMAFIMMNILTKLMHQLSIEFSLSASITSIMLVTYRVSLFMTLFMFFYVMIVFFSAFKTGTFKKDQFNDGYKKGFE